MKKLLIISAVAAMPLFSGAVLAECQHGGYALHESEGQKELLASELDPEQLALLRKQLEQKEALQSEPAVVSYN